MNQVSITQEEYISLNTLEPNTLYFIEDKPSLITTYQDALDEMQNMIEQYKKDIKLRPNSCVNCGGSIDGETLHCKFCGTSYRI